MYPNIDHILSAKNKHVIPLNFPYVNNITRNCKKESINLKAFTFAKIYNSVYLQYNRQHKGQTKINIIGYINKILLINNLVHQMYNAVNEGILNARIMYTRSYV